MSAARPSPPSAEPILLTEATLEHVLDVFLPESPDAGAGDSVAAWARAVAQFAMAKQQTQT